MGLLSRQKKSSPLGYAAMLFGITVISQLFYAFNNAYYNDSGMVNIKWASITKIIFVVVDWLNDLIFGALSEKTRSKWGKRVPWIVYGCSFLPLFVLLTYAVNKETGFSEVGFVIYYIFISISYENASTIMSTNYNAMYPTLFVTNEERSKTSTWKYILEAAAMAVCYMLTPVLRDQVFAGQTYAYIYIGAIYAAIFYICVFIMLKTSRIQDDVKAAETNISQYSLHQTLRDAFSDRAFVFYNLAQACLGAIMAIAVTLFEEYFKYCLGDPEGVYETALFAAAFGSVLIFIPLWKWAIGKYGPIKVWLFGFIVMTIALLGFLIPHDFLSAVIVMPFICFIFGSLLISPDMIFAEIIDIDKYKHHISREAALGSIGNLIGRIVVIVSSIVTIIIAMNTGYESGINPGDNPDLTFRLFFGAMLPAISLIGTIFALLFIKYSKKDREIMKEIKNENAETAKGPETVNADAK
jgi:GPH family glycoside/pentoside/hexuronide:cation symporter